MDSVLTGEQVKLFVWLVWTLALIPNQPIRPRPKSKQSNGHPLPKSEGGVNFEAVAAAIALWTPALLLRLLLLVMILVLIKSF